MERIDEAELLRRYASGERDFAGVDLSSVDLNTTKLIDINLANTNLIDANLSDANLTGANLDGAQLINANLNGANLALLDLWWKLYRKAQKNGGEIAEILTLRHISYINHRIARRAAFLTDS